MEAYADGKHDGINRNYQTLAESPEQYYNQTYNNENKQDTVQ